MAIEIRIVQRWEVDNVISSPASLLQATVSTNQPQGDDMCSVERFCVLMLICSLLLLLVSVILNFQSLLLFLILGSFYSFWFFFLSEIVYGKEYGFGAHDFSASGVFEAEPKTCPGFIYRCSINLGQIHISPSEFRTFIENMASEYHGDTYHLISKNCNHFTNDVSYRLIGKQTPGWVNRLAKLGKTRKKNLL